MIFLLSRNIWYIFGQKNPMQCLYIVLSKINLWKNWSVHVFSWKLNFIYLIILAFPKLTIFSKARTSEDRSKVCTGRPGTTMNPYLPLNKATFTTRTNCWDSPVSVNSESVPTLVWSMKTSKMSSVNATTLTLPILRTRLLRPMLITTQRKYRFRSYLMCQYVSLVQCLEN